MDQRPQPPPLPLPPFNSQNFDANLLLYWTSWFNLGIATHNIIVIINKRLEEIYRLQQAYEEARLQALSQALSRSHPSTNPPGNSPSGHTPPSSGSAPSGRRDPILVDSPPQTYPLLPADFGAASAFNQDPLADNQSNPLPLLSESEVAQHLDSSESVTAINDSHSSNLYDFLGRQIEARAINLVATPPADTQRQLRRETRTLLSHSGSSSLTQPAYPSTSAITRPNLTQPNRPLNPAAHPFQPGARSHRSNSLRPIIDFNFDPSSPLQEERSATSVLPQDSATIVAGNEALSPESPTIPPVPAQSQPFLF